MQDDKIIWSSNSIEDWVYGLSDEELIQEVSALDDDMDYYLDDDGEYDFDRLRSRLLPDGMYDPCYEDLTEAIIPAIEEQCYNNMIWFIGNYQRWNGGHRALGFFDDVENFFNNDVLNEESNVCFGEGGAGTFSDGKLTTNLNDPRIKFILKSFAYLLIHSSLSKSQV